MVLEVPGAILAGMAIGLSLAAPPGPANAVIASHTVTRSLRAGIFAGLGATTADTIFLIVTVLARSALGSFQRWIPFVALLGAGLMVYLAWRTARVWPGADAILESKPEDHARSYWTGLSVNLSSPWPILWWLTVGLILIDQLGPAVLVGFFGGLALWITAFPLALREAQRRIRRTYQAVLVFSIACLLGFAAWLVWSAVAALL